MKNPELVALLKTKYPKKTEDDLSSKIQAIIAGLGSEMTIGHNEKDVYLQCSRCQAKYIIQQDWDIDDNNELLFCVNEHCYLSQFIPPNFVINEIYNYDKNTFNTERADTGFVSLTCKKCHKKSTISIYDATISSVCHCCPSEDSHTIDEYNDMEKYVQITCNKCSATYQLSQYAANDLLDLNCCPSCNRKTFYKLMYYTSTQKCFWIDDMQNSQYLTKANIPYMDYNFNLLNIYYTHIEGEEDLNNVFLFVYEDNKTIQFQVFSYSMEQFTHKSILPSNWIVLTQNQYEDLFKAIMETEPESIPHFLLSSSPLEKATFYNYIKIIQQLIRRDMDINNILPCTYRQYVLHPITKQMNNLSPHYIYYVKHFSCRNCRMLLLPTDEKCILCGAPNHIKDTHKL